MPFVDLQSRLGINLDRWLLLQSGEQPNKRAARCHAFEKEWIECSHGIGQTRAKKECQLEFEDFYECMHRQKTRLQIVQNASARLLTETSKYSHVTPFLIQLHWLPIEFRVHFKILVLTYRALHGQAPSYIIELLQTYVPSRSLRSCDQGLLIIHHTKWRVKGDRAFATVAPRLWSSLPLSIRSVDSVASFKKTTKNTSF
uniref:NADH dehydrogenase [ubiquinone] iron-sulfur protein 5 n=1 Tax=Astatotilapia calliptera TaxID=8154 RepID=A0AAX7T0J0_ASTCA